MNTKYYDGANIGKKRILVIIKERQKNNLFSLVPVKRISFLCLISD